jgi:protein TonB
MPGGGFYEARRISQTSLGAVIAIHAAAIGALALSKMEVPPRIFTPLKTIPIPETKLPPERSDVLPPARQPETLTVPRPIERVEVTTAPRAEASDSPPLPITWDTGPIVKGDPLPAEPMDAVAPDPVRVEARLAPGIALQPPYPPSEERAGAEGSVRVRVTIGVDGRVRAVEQVSATSAAFYRATERQALRHWRFRPATLDGRPVESRLVLEVIFRLQG